MNVLGRDSRKTIEKYQIGDKVYIKTSDRLSKTSPRYEGPFEIIRKRRDIHTMIRTNNITKRTSEFDRHVSDLKLAHSSSQNQIIITFDFYSHDYNFIYIYMHLFHKVRPLIWSTTQYDDEIGTIICDINFKSTSPCCI